MTIPNKLIKKWETELKQYGLMDSCVEMDLSYPTVHRAINTGSCTQKTYDTINAYLLNKRVANKVIASKVLAEDQD